MLNDDMTEASIEALTEAPIITWVPILPILSRENPWVHSTLPNPFLDWVEVTQETELLGSGYYSKTPKMGRVPTTRGLLPHPRPL